MTIDLFLSLSANLDALVLVVGDLALADDIHPAIRKVAEYRTGLIRLPAALAKLEAQKASADASIPVREEAVRKANHPVRMAEAKLKKLKESLERNLAISGDGDTIVATTVPTVLQGIVIPTRQELIERLSADIAATEAELAAARAKAKKAESNRKGAVTRAANLANEIDAAKADIAAHAGRLPETLKVLRKTINRLRDRQAHRDRKRVERSSAPIAVETASAAEPPKGPSDEDIRKMAASHGLPVVTEADLEAARQLFLN